MDLDPDNFVNQLGVGHTFLEETSVTSADMATDQGQIDFLNLTSQNTAFGPCFINDFSQIQSENTQYTTVVDPNKVLNMNPDREQTLPDNKDVSLLNPESAQNKNLQKVQSKNLL